MGQSNSGEGDHSRTYLFRGYSDRHNRTANLSMPFVFVASLTVPVKEDGSSYLSMPSPRRVLDQPVFSMLVYYSQA